MKIQIEYKATKAQNFIIQASLLHGFVSANKKTELFE